MDNLNETITKIQSHIVEITTFEDGIKAAMFQGRDVKTAAKLLAYLDSIRKQLELKVHSLIEEMKASSNV